MIARYKKPSQMLIFQYGYRTEEKIMRIFMMTINVLG